MALPFECAGLDEVLGGGLEAGAITLVYGEAGTGKTNLCLQATRNAARSGNGKVGYVDTEGVSMERLRQICHGKPEEILKQILFFEPRTLAEQEKMILSLDKIRNPRLIVVDSMNMHYRLILGDNGKEATHSITRQLGGLLNLARTQDVPVLVTGQVYGSDDSIRPFGGRVMEHIVKTMVRLERTGQGTRRAVLYKHRSRPEGSRGAFSITASGLA